MVPLFFYMNEIAGIFTEDPELQLLLVRVLPIMIINFLLNVIQFTS